MRWWAGHCYNCATCANITEVIRERKMGDKVIPVKVAVRVRPLVPKEVREGMGRVATREERSDN